MARKPLLTDVDDIIRRYQTGESADAIGKTLGVSGHTIKARLANRGIPIRDRATANILSRLRPIDNESLIARYAAGESELALSKAYNLARSGVRGRLLKAGMKIRSQSDFMIARMAKLPKSERIRLSQSARAAIKGRTQSMEEKIKRALTVERHAANRIMPKEADMAAWLRGAGIEVIHQKAIGPYNIDVAVPETRIAVEIFGGTWHSSGRHAKRYSPRIEYLLGKKWLPVIVWVTQSWRLEIAAAEYVIALHQRIRRGESCGRQEHVIRGDGYAAAPSEIQSHNGTIKTGPCRRIRHRGKDGRFR